MNFLAHLHLAHLADSSLSGNLLADFVRGNPADEWPADVVEGIFMHRRIDVLTDNLPEVTEAKAWFRAETRRVAGCDVGPFFVTPLGAAVAGTAAAGVYPLRSRPGHADPPSLPAALYQSQ